MHDYRLTYLPDATWQELLHALNHSEALRLLFGVKTCPFSGMVEEYTMADRLGGELNIWPTKWREAIEVDPQQALAA